MGGDTGSLWDARAGENTSKSCTSKSCTLLNLSYTSIRENKERAEENALPADPWSVLQPRTYALRLVCESWTGGSPGPKWPTCFPP